MNDFERARQEYLDDFNKRDKAKKDEPITKPNRYANNSSQTITAKLKILNDQATTTSNPSFNSIFCSRMRKP